LTDISADRSAASANDARRLGDRLKGLTKRASVHQPLPARPPARCELAGFGATATVDPDLVEWNYGQYEGKTTAEIRREGPGWQLFRDGCPGGESLAEVAARADRMIAKVRSFGGDVSSFSSGHFLRAFGARWCGLDPAVGRHLYLGTAA